MDKDMVAKAKQTSLQSQTVSLMDAIKRQEAGFKLALPKNYDASRFTRIVMTAVRQNPKLQQCSKESLLASMMLSAQLGLEPNSPLQESYVIPYGDKAEFQVGYRGLLKLAWNSGLITLIDYDKICENDKYEYSKGFDAKFKHQPAFGDRGKAIAYYAYAEIKGGGKALHLMSTEEIEAHAKRFSKAYKSSSSPWKSDFDAMAIKTVIIQLADKKLPKATTNEAIMFHQAVSKDSTINSMPEDKFGRSVEVEEFEVVDVAEELAEEKKVEIKVPAKRNPVPKEVKPKVEVDEIPKQDPSPEVKALFEDK